MKKETYPIRKNLTFVFAILTLIIFGGSFVLSLRPGVSVSAMRDANTDTPTPVSTSTPTRTRTPTLISGVLTCNTVTAGVTCVNYGAYLDYNINKVVTGLTGGATAPDITIGTYKRTTNGGSMGMSSNFLHCETSTFSNNTVYSAVGLKPFDAGWVGYPGFTSGSGTNVCVTNNVPTDWRYIPGSGGWPNTISVKGNVDWAITGYSIVGHIYLYSNQNFMTVTPTMTPSPTATATATMTRTPTVTPTYSNSYNYDRVAAVAYAGQWAHSRNENYPNYGVDADGDQCNDCTNYISQILEAGGMPQIPGGDNAFHWYTYQNIWGTWLGSKSWAATDWFNRHVTQFQGVRYEYYPTGPANLSGGDFFLMDLPTNPFEGPDHARIIMGMGTVLEGDYIGEWRLLASQHCIDRQRVAWNYNLPQNVLLWAWHVVY